MEQDDAMVEDDEVVKVFQSKVKKATKIKYFKSLIERLKTHMAAFSIMDRSFHILTSDLIDDVLPMCASMGNKIIYLRQFVHWYNVLLQEYEFIVNGRVFGESERRISFGYMFQTKTSELSVCSVDGADLIYRQYLADLGVRILRNNISLFFFRELILSFFHNIRRKP